MDEGLQKEMFAWMKVFRKRPKPYDLNISFFLLFHSCVESCWIMLNIIEYCWICWILLNIVEYCWILLKIVESCRIMLNHPACLSPSCVGYEYVCIYIDFILWYTLNLSLCPLFSFTVLPNHVESCRVPQSLLCPICFCMHMGWLRFVGSWKS